MLSKVKPFGTISHDSPFRFSPFFAPASLMEGWCELCNKPVVKGQTFQERLITGQFGESEGVEYTHYSCLDDLYKELKY